MAVALLASTCILAQQPVVQQPPPAAAPGSAAASPTSTPQDEGTPTDPRTRTERKLPVERQLSPLEERERQIRMLDLKDRADPRFRTPADRQDGTGKPPPAPAPTLRFPEPVPGAGAPTTGTTRPQAQGAQTGTDEGPKVVSGDAELPAAADYTGPAVLTRNYTLSRNVGPQAIKWHWSVGYTEIFDTAANGNTVPNPLVAGTATPPTGAPTTPAATGGSQGRTLTWTVSTMHRWKRDLLSVNYNGSNTNYSAASSYSGTNQGLSSKYARILSSRLSLGVDSSAQIVSRSSSLDNALAHSTTSIADLNLAISPVTQLGDQGTHLISIQTNLSWRQSSRLSLSIGSAYVGIRNTGLTSLGISGLTQQFDLNYRMDRTTTVGAYYSHSGYMYSHRLNVSDNNTAGGIFSWAPSKSLEVSLRGGITVSQSESLQLVVVNPAFAILIGRGSGISDFYRVTAIPDVSAQVSRRFARGRTMRIAFTEGVVPGTNNGTTSTMKAMVGSYTASVFRSYNLSLDAGWNSIDAVTAGVQNNLSNSSKFIGSSVTRNFRHGVGSTFGVDYRWLLLPGTAVSTTQFRVTYGVTWGPGEGKLW